MFSAINVFTSMLEGTPKLRSMSTGQISIVIAMRVTILARAQGMGVKCYLAKQMPGEDAARHFLHIIEAMCESWPEPVMVHRPCCNKVSYDEVLLLDLVTAAARDDTKTFHNRIRDMIGERDRLTLLNSIAKFVQTCRGHQYQT